MGAPEVGNGCWFISGPESLPSFLEGRRGAGGAGHLSLKPVVCIYVQLPNKTQPVSPLYYLPDFLGNSVRAADFHVGAPGGWVLWNLNSAAYQVVTLQGSVETLNRCRLTVDLA